MPLRLQHQSLHKVDDKNPKNGSVRTPLELATSKKHLKIKKLIENAIESVLAGSNQESNTKK